MKHLAIVTAAVASLALTACSSGNPLASSAPASSAPASSAAAVSVVVGSANFPESELLAEIYAGALKAKGVQVTPKLNIASRETYVPALQNGEIDLIPEYTG
ncbi:MAG: glycine/betaine ABC transporter substrate-binding protein, partial [Actinobacteria bacterium]|nr:glycine/betaine ABC transporter substrate-binding protein [Actinomycetota bacterium]